MSVEQINAVINHMKLEHISVVPDKCEFDTRHGFPVKAAVVPGAGWRIDHVVLDCIILAQSLICEVALTFNDTELSIHQTDTVERVTRTYLERRA